MRSAKGQAKRGRLVCLHEAGHFVAAVSQGHSPRNLRAELDGSGRVDWAIPYTPHASFDRDDKLIRAWAGIEAERRVTRKSVFVLTLGPGSEDYAEAVELLRSAHRQLLESHPEQGQRLIELELEEGRRAARDLLRAHWPAVEAVARLLQLHGEVSGAEALAAAYAADPGLRVVANVARLSRAG